MPDESLSNIIYEVTNFYPMKEEDIEGNLAAAAAAADSLYRTMQNFYMKCLHFTPDW